MDEDYLQKNTITRSFAKKVNLGNYESADFFSSQTMIVPNDTSLLDYHQMSEDLFAIVMAEVEQQVAQYRAAHASMEGSEVQGDWDAFARVLDNTSEFKSASMADFQKLSPFQTEIVNKLKKAYKRSPEFKQRVGNTTVENEQGRKS